MANQCEVDFDTLLYSGIGKPLGHPVAVGFVGKLFPNLGQVVLAIGVLAMRQQLSPFAHEMYPAPEEVARGTHLRRIHICLWEHAPA